MFQADFESLVTVDRLNWLEKTAEKLRKNAFAFLKF